MLMNAALDYMTVTPKQYVPILMVPLVVIVKKGILEMEERHVLELVSMCVYMEFVKGNLIMFANVILVGMEMIAPIIVVAIIIHLALKVKVYVKNVWIIQWVIFVSTVNQVLMEMLQPNKVSFNYLHLTNFVL